LSKYEKKIDAFLLSRKVELGMKFVLAPLLVLSLPVLVVAWLLGALLEGVGKWATRLATKLKKR